MLNRRLDEASEDAARYRLAVQSEDNALAIVRAALEAAASKCEDLRLGDGSNSDWECGTLDSAIAIRAMLPAQATDAGNVTPPLIAEATLEVPSQSDIAQKIRALSDSMSDIAVEMDYFGGMAEWAKHSAELMQASQIAENWADEIDAIATSAKDAP
jgi:hypothetical protein